MTRREFAAATAGAAVASGTGQGAQRRPNLVYVFADQLSLHHCGYGGDEHAHTPNIDRLAAESFSFSDCIASSPVCAPYRATLMTGKYQSSTGMVINELRLSPQHECFGHVLTRAGYQTGYIGKWHLWANELGHHDETRNGFVPPGPYRLGFDGLWAGYNFNHTYYNSPYFGDTPQRLIHKLYEPDSQTTMAIDWLKGAARKTDPFALFLSWGPPHDPWGWDNVPPEYAEMFRDRKLPVRPNYSEQRDPYADDWARPSANYYRELPQFMQAYYAQTANIDWNLGRLTRALDEAGVAGDTIFVFTSDHGEMFGSHGRRAKYIFYEEAARVPFLMRWPGRTPKGRGSKACFHSPDIMPTLLDMMGLKTPRAVEGSSFSGVALGKSNRVPDAAFLQGMGTTAAWKDGTEWRAVRDQQHTYAVYRVDGKELLFDNTKDPFQMKNLADDRSQAKTVIHYRERLKHWRKEHNDAFEACTWYENRWTRDRNIIDTASGVKQDLGTLRAVQQRYKAQTADRN
ncbi:sulfatase [uncultured Paludibaculum sp.]|uniref:sulfatase family protein n=1 Tax=uncultured Paludibaculum sp. TaxID=1765020 RepID=UPI002AABDA04|nr:sulfatase [uncultured Paludibaculum sp.]